MKTRNSVRGGWVRLAVLALLLPIPVCAQAGESIIPFRTPLMRPDVNRSFLLDVCRAGNRLVAVGEGGVIALSDDGGRTFRRASVVPVQASLTGVYFVGEKRGWAVGHWGVVLHTEDGGETWTLQRHDAANDVPLFSVHFVDAQNGVAVGLWSLILKTNDGGKTWTRVTVPPPAGAKNGDRNLFHLFADKAGRLYATAEAGLVLRSSDGGESWSYIQTGYNGSLWAGLALSDGALLVGGLRGTLMRSDDDGATWKRLELSERSSVTALSMDQRGGVIGVGLDGLRLYSHDGRNFSATRLDGRPTLSGVIPIGQADVLFISERGPIAAQQGNTSRTKGSGEVEQQASMRGTHLP